MGIKLHELHRHADPAGAAQADAADGELIPLMQQRTTQFRVLVRRDPAVAVRYCADVQAIQPATEAEMNAALQRPEIGLHIHSLGDGFRSGVRWSEARVNAAAAPVYGDAVEALLLAAKDAADSLEAAAKIVRPQFPGSAHLMDERREALQAALAAVRKPAGVR